jgi:hypothetical protein
MRKLLSVVVVAVSVMFLVSANPAGALGGESLACAVFPNTQQAYTTGGCTNPVSASSYGIDFRVLGGTGSYSYAWTVSKGQITSGCTSTSTDCWVTVPAKTYTQLVTATVQLTQNGSSETLTETADIEPYCNGIPC